MAVAPALHFLWPVAGWRSRGSVLVVLLPNWVPETFK